MDYVPRKRDTRHPWLTKLSEKVSAEAVKFGAPAPDATVVKTAADDIIAKMNATNAAAAVLNGLRQQEATALAAGLATIRAKVRNFKTLPLWAASGSEAVLELKGSGPEFDAGSYKPVITLTIEAGKIVVDFDKDGADGLAIYGRLRGTAAWQKLGVDYEAPYYDTRPLAQAGVAEVREFMARGIVGDDEIGQDSDIVSIAFAG